MSLIDRWFEWWRRRAARRWAGLDKRRGRRRIGFTLAGMIRALLVVGVVTAAAATGGVVAAVAGDDADCEAARTALTEHRAEQGSIRAAYAISVRNGWADHVERLGPKMVTGEQETERLLEAMYQAC